MGKDPDAEPLERILRTLNTVKDELRRLDQRLDDLDGRIEGLEAQGGQGKRTGRVVSPERTWLPTTQPTAAVAAPPPGEEPEVEDLDALPGPAPAPAPAREEYVVHRAPTRPAPAAPQPAPVREARPPRDLEALVGGNLLPKIGIAILVIGVVFLLKLAFDEGWIGPRARVTLGIIGGLALAVVGELLWKSGRTNRVYPQVLAGGGVVIAYFTIYAAYAIPEYRELLGVNLQMASLGLGTLVVALTAYAHWRRAQVLAAEAAVLGGVAIVFGGEWIAFAIAYSLLLSLGVSFVAARHEWRPAAFLALLSPIVALFVPTLIEDVPVNWAGAAAVLVSLVAVATGLGRSWRDLAITGVIAGNLFVAVTSVFADAGIAPLVLLAVLLAASLYAALRQDIELVGVTATVGAFVALGIVAPQADGLTLVPWSLVVALPALVVVASTAWRPWPTLAPVVVAAAQLPLLAVAFQHEAVLEAASAAAVWFLAAWVAVPVAVAVAAAARSQPAGVYAAAASLAFATFWFGMEGIVDAGQLIVAALVVSVALMAASTVRVWVYGGVSAVAVAALALLVSPRVETAGLVAGVLLPLLAIPLAARTLDLDEAEAKTLLGLAGATFVLGALSVLRSLTVMDQEAWRGPSVAAFAVVALLLAIVWRQAARDARIGWAAGGLILAASWPPIQFDGSATAVSWTLMLAVLAFVLLRRPSVWLQLTTMAFALLATGHVLWVELWRVQDGTLEFVPGLFVFLLLTLVLVFFWAVVLARPVSWAMGAEDDRRANMALRELPLIGSAVVPVLYLGVLLDGVWITLAWALEASAFVVAGFAVRQKELRLVGLGVFVLVLARIAFIDVQSLQLVYRVITFIAVGALLLAVSFLYARRRRGGETLAATPETEAE